VVISLADPIDTIDSAGARRDISAAPPGRLTSTPDVSG
jgi:hypothetical protein